MIYGLCKRVINGGNYEYSSMLTKLDVFLLANRIEPDEFTELKGIMDEQQETS